MAHGANATVIDLRDVQGRAIASGAEHLGNVVLYDTGKICVPRARLKAIFAAHGEDIAALCPESLDPSTALGRAMGVPMPGDMKAERITFKNSDTVAAFMLYQITRRTGESGDIFTPGARLRVQADRVVVLPPEDGTPIAVCMEYGKVVAEKANSLIDNAEGRDLTGAAIKVITGPLRGYAMRDKGGCYFLRPSDGARWDRFAADLEPYGLVNLAFPMAGDARSKSTAAHVVRTGLEDRLKELRDELTKVSDSTRRGTIEARANDANKLIDEASVFADLLGGMRDAIVASAQQVRSDFLAQLGVSAPPRAARALRVVPTHAARTAEPEPAEDDDLFNFNM